MAGQEPPAVQELRALFDTRLQFVHLAFLALLLKRL